MSTTSTSTNSSYLKPLITGAVAVAGDRFLLNQLDMNKSLYFGGAVAAGTFLGAMVGDSIPVVIPEGGTYYDAKTLEQRLAEVGASAAAAYVINTQILKNDYQFSQMYSKLALIAGSDFIAEYIVDYYENRNLSFFA
jgi:hypothetical protein